MARRALLVSRMRRKRAGFRISARWCVPRRRHEMRRCDPARFAGRGTGPGANLHCQRQRGCVWQLRAALCHRRDDDGHRDGHLQSPAWFRFLSVTPSPLGIGGGSSYATRSMGGPSPRLSYQLYRDSAYSQVWGDGTAGTYTVTDGYLLGLIFPITKMYTVYGSIPASAVCGVGVVYRHSNNHDYVLNEEVRGALFSQRESSGLAPRSALWPKRHC